jgi:hypothetical protein
MNKGEFISGLTSEAELAFKPMGELLSSFSVSGRDGEQRTFVVYLASEATPGLRSNSPVEQLAESAPPGITTRGSRPGSCSSSMPLPLSISTMTAGGSSCFSKR